jgi:isoleucyl-tRNA synthetase
MYLEGSDQHRGWFQSSLLVALATRGRPPFREVLTHGFLIDLEGRKMSKSIGNVIAPQDVIKESGAEILRLWVAMSDYSEELRVSKEILTRVVDAYRKLRNTCRILAANLYDFDPAADAVPFAQLDEVDRFALSRYADTAERVTTAFAEYDFAGASKLLTQLATVDLSAFYVDVTKDRMYTFAAASPARRSTQTVMFHICDGLARLLAPILPVTADDLWRALPGTRTASVHLAAFPETAALVDRDLMARWDTLLGVRAAVNAALEEKRKAKEIGTSLGAHVTVSAGGPIASLLQQYARDLPMLFIVSEVTLHVAGVAGSQDPADERRAATGQDGVRVEVTRAHGTKCERCWRYVSDISAAPDWAGICGRCIDALGGTSPSVA